MTSFIENATAATSTLTSADPLARYDVYQSLATTFYANPDNSPEEKTAVAQFVRDELVRVAALIPTAYKRPLNNGRAASLYQQLAFWQIAEGARNILINAVAGSGKTTTIENVVNFLSPKAQILVVAFNVKIKQALEKIFNGRRNVSAKTFNGFGYGICVRNAKTAREVTPDKTSNTIRYRFFDFDSITSDEKLAEENKRYARYAPPIRQLVALFKHHNFHQCPDLATVAQFASRHDINIPTDNDGNILPDWSAMLEGVYDRVIKNLNVFDYDDQVFQPVYNNWSVPQYDYVIVDESQDISPIQFELLIRAVKPTGKMVFVGDRQQAIYGFRGADTAAIDNIVKRTSARELPLSICYRCPKTVVAKAQTIVPQIEASPTAPDGAVLDIPVGDIFKTAQAGDFVLCRTTAPLVEMCLAFIREGKRATVLGRDIGQNLIALADTIHGMYIATKLPLSEKIDTYRAEKGEKLAQAKREQELVALNDRCDTLLAILATCENNFAALKGAVEKLFSDDATETAVVFSTIHKAKGLERPTVFILHPELLPHPSAKQDWQKEQEKNLEYVAYTRAMNTLYIVLGKLERKEQPKPAAKTVAEIEAERERLERDKY